MRELTVRLMEAERGPVMKKPQPMTMDSSFVKRK
jgi:hypothetical protein